MFVLFTATQGSKSILNLFRIEQAHAFLRAAQTEFCAALFCAAVQKIWRNEGITLRVLHIANTYFFVERLLPGKLEGLRKAGWEVHAAAPLPPQYQKDTPLPCWFHPLPMARNIAPFEDIRTLFSCVRLIAHGRYDLIHTHTAKAGFLGRLAAWLCEVPCLHTVHGLPYYEGQPFFQRNGYRALEWLAAHWCAGILSQNHEDIERLRALHALPPERLFYEGNGLDFEEVAQWSADREEVRQELKLEKDDVAIALLARLEPVKDHRTFLKAFEEVFQTCPHAVAVIAGANFGRNGTYEREILRAFSISPAKGRIRMLGYRKDAGRILAGCDILALTSEKEGLPRVVMEAMGLGLAVAATDVPGTRELIRDGITGLLVPAGNSHALADAFRRLISSPILRVRLGTAAQRFARQELDERQVISRILNAYQYTVT